MTIGLCRFPQLTHRYLWGDAVDQLLADEQVSSTTAAGNVIWPLTDHLGTVRDAVDLSASTVNHVLHRVHDAFGNLVSETNPSSPSSAAADILFGFTSRPFDDSTGLQNNLNRWYDPVTGQWKSKDPIGFLAGDPNLQRYVTNDALASIDPSGLAEIVFGDPQNGAVIVHKTGRIAVTGDIPVRTGPGLLEQYDASPNIPELAYQNIKLSGGNEKDFHILGKYGKYFGLDCIIYGAENPEAQSKRLVTLVGVFAAQGAGPHLLNQGNSGPRPQVKSPPVKPSSESSFLGWRRWFGSKTNSQRNAGHNQAGNAKLRDYLNSSRFQNLVKQTDTIDCNDLAENLFRANGGKGQIIEFTASIGKEIIVPESGANVAYKYHHVFVVDGMVYDPRFSPNPIEWNQYKSLLNTLNPNGFNSTKYMGE